MSPEQYLPSLLLLALFVNSSCTSAEGYTKHKVLSTCLVEDDAALSDSAGVLPYLTSPTTPVQFSCPSGQRIHIQHAYFGAAAAEASTGVATSRRYSCRHSPGNCFRMDASLNRVCNGLTDCVTSVRSPGPVTAGGDCRKPVEPTYYQVVYECVADRQYDVCRTGRLIAQRGYVISPGYPEAYQAGLNCTLVLGLPAPRGRKSGIIQRQKIRLTLLSLDLDCNSSLTLIDSGRTNQPRIWRSCGQRRMESAMQADGPEVRVSLTTGPVAGVGFTGFWLYYEASPLIPESASASTKTMDLTTPTNLDTSPAVVLVGDATSHNIRGSGGTIGGNDDGSVFVDYRDRAVSSGRFSGYGDSVVIFLVILVTSLLVMLAIVLATFVFKLFKAKESVAREYDDSHEILYSPSTVPLSMAGLPHSISGTCGFYDNRGEQQQQQQQQQPASINSATMPAPRSRPQNRFKLNTQLQQQQQLLLLPQPIRGAAADCCSASRRSGLPAAGSGSSANEYQDLGEFAATAASADDRSRRRSDGAIYSETSNV